MKYAMKWLPLLLSLWFGAASAGLESYDFSGNVDEKQFKELISELRCLVCQNQSLGDSDAGLADDLRREVYDLMDQGHSDQEIVDFLVSRYGDFVLYDPPIKPSTYILWYGPGALLLVGVLLLGRTLRQRRAQIRTETDLSEEERRRLNQLLHEQDEATGDKQ